MEFQDFVDFANKNKTCYLATVEGNQPHVRALGMWFADDNGFYFQTESVKSMTGQLRKNNNVELCFTEGMKVMRIMGKVEFVNDEALKARVLEERPFLKDFIMSPKDPILVLFRVVSGEAYFWTMANNMKESMIERLRFTAE